MDMDMLKLMVGLLSVCGCFIFGVALPAMGEGMEKQAWIDARMEEKAYVFSGFCVNQSDHQLWYKMGVLKEGTSGKSQSSQSGHIPPGHDQPVTLSSSRIGIYPGDHVTVTLQVVDGSDVIATDETSINIPR